MPDLDRRAAFSLVRRGVAFELRLYRSLLRWVTRRPVVPGPGVEAFGYAKAVTPLMWVWIFASAVEIPLLHLLPWHTVRLVALALGVWGLVWMVGLLASLKVHPHLLGDSALRVRYGVSVDISIPWDAVATVAVARRDLPSSTWTLQRRDTAGGTDLQVGVSGEVNVHARLRRPMTVPTPKGGVEVIELSFLADDPRALVARARQSLTVEATGPDRRARDQA